MYSQDRHVLKLCFVTEHKYGVGIKGVERAAGGIKGFSSTFNDTVIPTHHPDTTFTYSGCTMCRFSDKLTGHLWKSTGFKNCVPMYFILSCHLQFGIEI